MNKLMPFLMTKFYKTEPSLYKKYNGIYCQYKCNFDEYFASKLRGGYTVTDLFYNVFNELTRWGTDANDDYRKCLRKWRYFVNNNVKYKTIKPGDKIEYSFFANDMRIKKAVVKEVYPQSGTVLVYDEEDRCNRIVYLGWIKRVNGNDFKIDYYIKYKGKTYGLD